METVKDPVVPVHIPAPTRKIHPQKFAMWFALGSILLMFAGFTSGYLVRRGQGMWEQFEMPQIFAVSTIVILLSSLTYFLGLKAYKKQAFSRYNLLMILTLILGIAFMVLQYLGFKQMYAHNIRINGNVSNSFFYVIAGAHLVHILGGIIALIVVLLKNRFFNKGKSPVGLEILGAYWHFIDILWLYLYVFLLMYR
ncbi:cytochrome oxidase subunit III [Taibaiella sp. KBW10]|uniref:cytochrome c oxidase subunit 3 n=1 Tax=Taibaiella sp. KBW10 TaxID=2153357 RepID=UPI000F5A6934|nr:cytochrome c oxidase subunit 3 [Taibaiella sp. KBW10]RQO30051.1 cytochrome oxidase subunit III [Taibaiella sp. KBW10]